MHPTACIIVTQFCNPDMFSNTHGLLERFLQCKSKKEKTLQGVKTKLTRFVSDSISSTVSPTPLTKKRGTGRWTSCRTAGQQGIPISERSFRGRALPFKDYP